MAEDLRIALHHIAHITHCYRGTCNIYESNPGQDFTAVCDFPDNQLVTLDVRPFITACSTRLLTTNPGAELVTRAVQEKMIQNGPNTTRLHRVFLTVRQKDQ